jgi:hypothetical protein
VPVPPDSRPVKPVILLNFRLRRSTTKGERTRGRPTGTQTRNAEIAGVRRLGEAGGVDRTHVGLDYDLSLEAVATARVNDRWLETASWKVEFSKAVFVTLEMAGAVTRNRAMAAPPASRLQHSDALVDRIDEPARFQVMNAVASALRVSRVPMFAPLPLVAHSPTRGMGVGSWRRSARGTETPDRTRSPWPRVSERTEVGERLVAPIVAACEQAKLEARHAANPTYQDVPRILPSRGRPDVCHGRGQDDRTAAR